MITKEQVRRARAKLIFWFAFSLVKYALLRKIIKEFKKQGIFEKHKDYVRAWLSYLDQKEFAEKLERQIIAEIKRYLATRDNKILDHIVEVIWNETNTEAWIMVIKKE